MPAVLFRELGELMLEPSSTVRSFTDPAAINKGDKSIYWKLPSVPSIDVLKQPNMLSKLACGDSIPIAASSIAMALQVGLSCSLMLGHAFSAH
jgi:hypothetical protein